MHQKLEARILSRPPRAPHNLCLAPLVPAPVIEINLDHLLDSDEIEDEHAVLDLPDSVSALPFIEVPEVRQSYVTSACDATPSISRKRTVQTCSDH